MALATVLGLEPKVKVVEVVVVFEDVPKEKEGALVVVVTSDDFGAPN